MIVTVKVDSGCCSQEVKISSVELETNKIYSAGDLLYQAYCLARKGVTERIAEERHVRDAAGRGEDSRGSL